VIPQPYTSPDVRQFVDTPKKCSNSRMSLVF
jgi:hypothetical protein